MDRTAEGEAMGGMGGSEMGVVAGIVLALLAVAAGWWHLRRAPAVLRATTAASPVHGDDSEPVEDAAGIPVVSAATATVFTVLTELGLRPEVPDAGRLLSGEITMERAPRRPGEPTA